MHDTWRDNDWPLVTHTRGCIWVVYCWSKLPKGVILVRSYSWTELSATTTEGKLLLEITSSFMIQHSKEASFGHS